MAPLDSYCKPRALADFYANANAADLLLADVATSLDDAITAFFVASSDFVPYLGVPGSDIRELKAANEKLNGFAMDVANAFMGVGANGQTLDTMDPEAVVRADSSAITATVPSVSQERARAEADRRAIEEALASGDEDALREALETSLAHSANGENAVYSATLVVLMGKPMIDQVLDTVDHDDAGVPDAEDVAAFAVPMATILQSATRGNVPAATTIAYDYIHDAMNVTSQDGYYGNTFDPPEARQRLGLLLEAGTGHADWVANAADVMLLGEQAANSPGTAYYNEVALEALAANDEAAFVYVAGGDLLASNQDDRLVELLNADWKLTEWADGMSATDDQAFFEQRERFNQLAGQVLESGLVDYPERNGDPFGMDPRPYEATRATEVYADIVNLVGTDAEGNPFSSGDDSGDDHLRNSLARIGSSTWMMDAMARDAANGPAASAPPATPDALASVEVLDDFYTELIASDDARRTLEAGTVAYVNVAMDQAIGSLDAEAVAASLAPGGGGDVPVPDSLLPTWDGAAAQVTALAQALNGEEMAAAETQQAFAGWVGALGEGVTGAAGNIPAAVLAPLTGNGLEEILSPPSELPGAGGVMLSEMQDESTALIWHAVQTDPRFVAIPPDQQNDIVNAIYAEFTGRLGMQFVVAEANEPSGP